MPSSDNFYLSIPIQLNYLIGQKHGLELGMGATFYNMSFKDEIVEVDERSTIYFNPSIMYRYQADWGLNLRLGIQPLIGAALHSDFGGATFWLWPGASVGYKF